MLKPPTRKTTNRASVSRLRFSLMSVFSAVLTTSITLPKQNGTAIVTPDDTSRNATAFIKVHFSGEASMIRLLSSEVLLVLSTVRRIEADDASVA